MNRSEIKKALEVAVNTRIRLNLLDVQRYRRAGGVQNKKEILRDSSLLSKIYWDYYWGKQAEIVLKHPQGLEELTRLVNEGWFYLNWPNPPEYSKSDFVFAVFKAPDFTPDYEFIDYGEEIMKIDNNYRDRNHFERFHLFDIEDPEAIDDLNSLLGIDDLKDVNLKISKRCFLHCHVSSAIRDSLSWFRDFEGLFKDIQSLETETFI